MRIARSISFRDRIASVFRCCAQIHAGGGACEILTGIFLFLFHENQLRVMTTFPLACPVSTYRMASGTSLSL